jgi:hypothetical protein
LKRHPGRKTESATGDAPRPAGIGAKKKAGHYSGLLKHNSDTIPDAGLGESHHNWGHGRFSFCLRFHLRFQGSNELGVTDFFFGRHIGASQRNLHTLSIHHFEPWDLKQLDGAGESSRGGEGGFEPHILPMKIRESRMVTHK